MSLVACGGRAQPDIRPIERGDASVSTSTNTSANETDPFWATRSGQLVHTPSGVACPLDLEEFVFVERRSFPGLPDGADVACFYESGTETSLTVHLTNFGRPVSAAEHFTSVKQSIIEVRSPIGPTEPPTDQTRLPITLSQAAFRLPATDDKPERETAVWIETMGLWHMKVRANYVSGTADRVGNAVASLYSAARRATASGAT